MKSSYHYHSDFSHERVYLNEFGRYLRDQADKDYIASRALYRRDLIIHSANLAHQSIEKYLKAILLFIGVDTRNFRHDIDALMDKNVRLGLIINDQSKDAIHLLSGLHNVTRYQGSGSFNVDYEFLFNLDYLVRDIRPWVQNRSVDERRVPHFIQKRISSGHGYKDGRIFLTGYLEKVLSSRTPRHKKLREDLIWNNPFFSSRRRRKVWIDRSSYASSFPFNLNSKKGRDLARHVGKFFKFEPEIVNYLKKIRD